MSTNERRRATHRKSLRTAPTGKPSHRARALFVRFEPFDHDGCLRIHACGMRMRMNVGTTPGIEIETLRTSKTERDRLEHLLAGGIVVIGVDVITRKGPTPERTTRWSVSSCWRSTTA